MGEERNPMKVNQVHLNDEVYPGARAVFLPASLRTRPLWQGVLCTLLVLSGNLVHAAWTPPPDPDPQAILREAQADATAKRYEDALAKHVWFHENALKLRSSLAGVRLSFALGYWKELGDAYPPALKKLREIRDQAASRVREGKETFFPFQEYVAINKVLKEDEKSGELFVWLDGQQPAAAKAVYDLAEPVLIHAKEYRLCGKYLAPEPVWKSTLNLYYYNRRLAEDPKFGKRMQEYGEKAFSQRVSTLVALLVLNERKAEAEDIAAKALKEWDDPGFKQQLEKAKRGEVPPPWP